MALGDITIYSADDGFGYPGDINYVVSTGTTVPQIFAGELVSKTLGSSNFVTAMASAQPVIVGYGGNPSSTYIVGVAASTSTEGTSGNQNGVVSVTPIDGVLTYLVGTLQTATYFGAYATGTGALTNQQVYDTTVGLRVTMARTGGVGSAQIGGVYTINSTDATGNGLVVEELDILKYPGKVRFSLRNSLSYRS